MKVVKALLTIMKQFMPNWSVSYPGVSYPAGIQDQLESKTSCCVGTDTGQQSCRGFRALPAESDASQGSERSYDYNQASFAQALQMLDSDPVSLGNSQDLTLGLAQEGSGTPGFTSWLLLSLDDAQESDAGVGENGSF